MKQIDEEIVMRAKAALELRRRTSSLNLFDWTERYRQYLKPDMKLDFRSHAYLKGLYQCEAKRVVVNKAAQMGASEYAVSYAIHAADQRKATVLYVFPTDIHVSDFSSARIGPAIEASDYLRSLVVDGGAEGQSGANRVTLKRIGNRFMYLRGAKVGADGQAPQLKSIDADVLILDEVDEMDERAAAIATKRLGHSSIAEERYISTPTYPGRGINAYWLQSDQREWFIPCPHCGHKQFLTLAHFVTEYDSLDRPVRWNGYPERAFGVCAKCGKELDRLVPGEWVATATSDLVGFHMTKLFSPLADPLNLIKNLQTTDETKRREALNQDLGETYTPKGGQITDAILDACRREYAHGARLDVRPVAGVDVGRVLHCVIRNPGFGDQPRPQVWAGAVDSWEELGRIFKRYRVRAAVIDAAPEATKAREFQRNFKGGRVWLAYYVNQGVKNIEPWKFDEKELNVMLDRTRTLDNTLSRFYDKVVTLPANARDIPDYYKHMKASVRVIEERSGIPTAVYVESGADHFCHAENYAMVAEQAPRVPLGIVVQGSVKGW